MFKELRQTLSRLTVYALIRVSCASSTQMHRWLKEIEERKRREPRPIDEEVVRQALALIRTYPHLSGPKGQAFLLYHRLGYLPQHIYKSLKKMFGNLIKQEVSKRRLLPAGTSYAHKRPSGPGDIWAEDFTEISVEGRRIKLAVLMDVASTYYLGTAVADRATSSLVATPVEQALALTGKGPNCFMLSDHGSQYVSDQHERLLEKREIVHQLIPTCKPQYNGAVECGIKEIKQVFYNVWAEREAAGVLPDRPLLERVREAVRETVRRMNEELPRPCLKGVTPRDLLFGEAEAKQEANRVYLEAELEKEPAKPWTGDKWQLVREFITDPPMDAQELLTKFCFFLKRPLRKIANLLPEAMKKLKHKEVSGNYTTIFSVLS